MSVLDKITVDLPPGLTHARREAEWVPGELPDEGTLTVRLWKGRRAGSRMEADTYAVQEEEPQPGVMGRSFLLLNLTDPDQEDVYRTVIGPRCHCTCKAGLVHRTSCKHVDALQVLVEECGV